MTGAAAFDFGGSDFVATPEGALWWPAEATLLDADLHLEKGSSFARRGRFLPPYDSRATLDRLGRLLTALSPRRVACLGDSFHDDDGAGRLAEEDADRLRGFAAGRDWLWIAGNHDPGPGPGIGGRFVTEMALSGISLRHRALEQEVAAVDAEISGHFHPKAAVVVGGRRVAGRCFVTDDRRLILPAFGAYAGGLDVFDPAIATLLTADFTVRLLARGRVYTLPNRRLIR